MFLYTLSIILIDSCLFFFKDDISKNKIATQSHTWVSTGGTDVLYEARNAVDGKTTTCMRTNGIGTNDPDKTVWWKVDLGGVYNIYSISILFKNYEGFGMYFLSITLIYLRQMI